MNTKIAKKVGEARAFAEVLANIQNKTSVLADLLGENATGINETTANQIKGLDKMAEMGGALEVVETKAAKTAEKITKMGEFYVGDEWEDAAEVLEWLSFFLGAAVIHWQLIAGAAKELGKKEFEDISLAGAEYYNNLLNTARGKAEEIGRERAQA